jgi:hypothetical protein
MKTFIAIFAVAAATLLAGELIKPAEILADSPKSASYLHGVAKLPGAVKLNVHLDAAGKIRRVEPISGRPELVAAAIRMVYDYKFAAAQHNGVGVPSTLPVDLHFKFAQ